MKTLLLGLGNTLVCDDGVGIRVVRELRGLLEETEIDIEEACLAGFDILDIIDSYERLVLVDSIKTRKAEPGHLHKLNLDTLASESCPVLYHSINLHAVIECGRKLGCRLPDKISVYAIEILDNTTITGKPTAPVEEKIPAIVQAIYTDLLAELAGS